MINAKIHQILTLFIASVWFINGFFAKVLNFVPRHEHIVSRILGEDQSFLIIKIIGFAEVMMAIWILSRFKSRLNAVIQIIVVAAMNILEFIFAPDLLLWGGLNAFVAFMFISIIYYNEFVLSKNFAE